MVGCEDNELVSWIPAHTSRDAVGVTITAEDRVGKAAADAAAKLPAQEGELSREDWDTIQALDEFITTVAKLIGLAGAIVSAKDSRDTSASQTAM